jgi:hypothetical protein
MATVGRTQCAPRTLLAGVLPQKVERVAAHDACRTRRPTAGIRP